MRGERYTFCPLLAPCRGPAELCGSGIEGPLLATGSVTVYLRLAYSLSVTVLLSVTVCHCLSLSVTVCHCLSQPVTVCHCLSLPVTVCHCLFLSVTVCHCLSLSVTVSGTVQHTVLSGSGRGAPLLLPGKLNRSSTVLPLLLRIITVSVTAVLLLLPGTSSRFFKSVNDHALAPPSYCQAKSLLKQWRRHSHPLLLLGMGTRSRTGHTLLLPDQASIPVPYRQKTYKRHSASALINGTAETPAPCLGSSNREVHRA